MYHVVKKGGFIQVAASLLIVSVLFIQLGLNLLHTHLGKAPQVTVAFKAANDDGSTPCKACSLDSVPTLYSETFYLASLTSEPFFFAEPVPAGILLPVSLPSLGRAPPIC